MAAEPAALAADEVLHTDWPLIDVGEADADRVCALFAEVFGGTMSRAFWHWKYGDGRGTGIGLVHPDGSLVAHYGGALREVRHPGGWARAVQACDVMVASRVRHVFSRNGPFGRITARGLERCFGPDHYADFGFGFPSARHLKLGSKLGFYWPIDRMWELAWSAPLASRTELVASYEPWGPPAVYDELRTLFAQAAPVDASWLWPRRDADVWRHRFANHPDHRYQLHFVQRAGDPRPCGAFVLKPGAAGAPWELMDWVVAQGGDLEAVFALATQRVLGQGGASMFLWASSTVVDALPRAVVQGAERRVACEVTSPQALVLGRPAHEWQGKIWLTGADTDFH